MKILKYLREKKKRMHEGCESTLLREMAEKRKSDVLQVESSHLEVDYVLRN